MRLRSGPWARGVVAAVMTAACSPGPAGPDTPDAPEDALDDAAVDTDAESGGDDASVPDLTDQTEGEDAEDDGRTTACRIVSEPTVETVTALSVGRYASAAATLASGLVLIAGGFDFAMGIQRTAEIFDPVMDSVVPTGALVSACNFPATAGLADGTIAVFGGFHPLRGSLALIQIFDPTLGEFRLARNRMAFGREAHTVTVLPDGRVLIAGGLNAAGFTFRDSAEIYDPVEETVVSIAVPMNSPRAFHAAVYVPARRSVLLIGGDSGRGELSVAERYEVESGEFWNVERGRARRAKAPAAALLPDGRVLAAGGANAVDGTIADADIYDPATDRFEPAAPMATRRMAHTLTALPGGHILAAGGWSDSSSPSASTGSLEVYDPAQGAWETLPIVLAQPRHDHAAILLDDCRVLIVGGQQVLGGGPPAAPREIEVVTLPLSP